MAKNKGFIKLYRSDDWKMEKPLYRAAWVWMLMRAAHQDNGDLKRGQLHFSIHLGPEVFGMSVRSTGRLLRRMVEDGSILWEKGRPGPPRKGATITATNKATITATNSGTITILKYSEYQATDRTRATNKATNGDPINDPSLKKEERTKKEEEVPLPPVENAVPKESSDNSQIYDRYVLGRRQACQTETWLPEANLAITMRSSIKRLLAKYSVADLLESLEGFFLNKWAREHGLPWQLFAADPIKHKTRGSPAKPTRNVLEEMAAEGFWDKKEQDSS